MNAGDNQEVIGMGSDVASLTPEDQALHTQALEAFASVESDPEAETLLTKYCETMENADFQLMASSLGQIQGLEQAAGVVKGNFFPQIDKFLIGVFDEMFGTD